MIWRQPTKCRCSCVLTVKYTFICAYWWTRQRIHNTLLVVDRYLWLMGDKTIPDSTEHCLELCYPPFVADIHLPHQGVVDSYNPFPNFKCTTVEVWEWKSNFIPHFIIGFIIYPFLVKGDTGQYLFEFICSWLCFLWHVPAIEEVILCKPLNLLHQWPNLVPGNDGLESELRTCTNVSLVFNGWNR